MPQHRALIIVIIVLIAAAVMLCVVSWIHFRFDRGELAIVVWTDEGLLIDGAPTELAGIVTADSICHATGFGCTARLASHFEKRLAAEVVHCRRWLQASDRQVATCHSDGQDLARIILREGYAIAGNATPDTYRISETTARRLQRGIWMAEPPGDINDRLAPLRLNAASVRGSGETYMQTANLFYLWSGVLVAGLTAILVGLAIISGRWARDQLAEAGRLRYLSAILEVEERWNRTAVQNGRQTIATLCTFVMDKAGIQLSDIEKAADHQDHYRLYRQALDYALNQESDLLQDFFQPEHFEARHGLKPADSKAGDLRIAEHGALMSYAAFLEICGYLARHDLIPVEKLIDLFGGDFIAAQLALSSWIRIQNKRDERAYENFRWLCAKLPDYAQPTTN